MVREGERLTKAPGGDYRRHCHEDVVQAMGPGAPGHGGGDGNEVSCLRCHHSVGHQELSPMALHTGGRR